MQIALVLHNIRSTYNVGAILRTAEGLGITKIIYSGYTPRYNDANLLPHLREKLNHQIAKSAIGAEEFIPQEAVDNLPNWLDEKKTQEATIFGLENNLCPEETKQKIILGQEKLPGTSQNLILILGEEVAGIPPEIRAKCDYFLEIPMQGKKESFNVSVATAIALWELTKFQK